MAGPWEDYQSAGDAGEGAPEQSPLPPPREEDGPWNDYAQPAQQQAAPEQGPWNDYAQPAQQQAGPVTEPGPWDDYGKHPKAESPAATFVRKAASDIVPIVGAIPAMTAGATIGQALIPIPFVGAGIGALAGGYLAGGALTKAQDIVKRVLGIDDSEQQAVNTKANPNADMWAGLPGVVAGFKSGAWKGAAALASHAGTAAFMGGVTAAQQGLEGEGYDPKAIALSAAEGGVFNEVRGGLPSKLAKLGETVGDRIIRGMRHGTAGPQAAGGVAQEATPPQEGLAGLGNTDTQPGERDSGNDGRYAKSAEAAEGSTAVENVQGGVSQEFQSVLSTLNKDENTGAPAAQPTTQDNNPPEGTAEATSQPPNTTPQWEKRPNMRTPQANNDNVQGAPEMVTGAAMRAPTGEIEQGNNHNEAVQKHDDAGRDGFGAERGYSTSHRPFVLEDEALKIAEDQGQVKDDALARNQKNLKSEDINFAPKAEPIAAKEEAAPERPVQPAPATEETLPAGAKPSSYEAPAPGNEYAHVDPSMRGILIRRGHPAPNMVGSNRANTEALIDPRVPRVIDAQTTDGKTKTLDPAQALAVRENARRQVLDMLSKEPDQQMPFATQLEASKEAGLHAEKMWLEQRGYDANAFRAQIEGFKTAPVPAKAPVTATVNYPKFVTRTLKALRDAKMTAAADALEAKIKGMVPKDQTAEASKAAKTINARQPENLTTQQLSKPLATPRLDKTGFEIDDLGVTAKTQKLADHHTQAIEAAEKAFDNNAPKGAETKDQLRARLTKAIGEARTENGGVEPTGAYRPQDPPEHWHWLNEAKLLTRGRMTQPQIAKFIANEKLLRGGDESVQAYKADRKGEGEIAMSRRSGEAAIAGAEAERGKKFFPGETPSEEAEATTPAEPVKAADLNPAERTKNLDIAELPEGKQAAIQADMAKTTEGLLNKPDDLTGQGKQSLWKAQEADRMAAQAEKTGALKRQREARVLAAKTATKAPEDKPSAVRKVEVTPEIAELYKGKSKVVKEQAQREAELQALEAGTKEEPSANPLKTMFTDESGSLNPAAIKKSLDIPQSKTSAARGSRSPAEDYADSISKKFAGLRGDDVSANIDAKKAADAIPEAVRAVDDKLYRAQDQDTVNHLNKNDETLFNRFIKPHLDRADQYFVNIKKDWPDLLGPEIKSHIWRMRIGGEGDELAPDAMHTGVSGDPVEGTTNPLYSGKVGPMYERDMVGLERSDGKRFVISPTDKGGGGFLSWENGKPRMVSDPSFTYKEGDPYTNGKNTYKMVKATTDEIEASTGMKYHKSAIMSAILGELRMSTIARHLQAITEIKNGPEFKLTTGQEDRLLATQNPKLAKENGWVEQKTLPAFKGWYMHPRLNEVMDDFAQPGLGGNDSVWNKVTRFSQAVLKTLFWLPTAHVENVGTHWFTARGLDWLTPEGYKSLVMDGGDAMRSVMTQDDFQREMRKRGAGLIYGSTITKDIVGQIAQAAGKSIEANPKDWNPIAKTLGVGVDDLVKGIYGASSKSMWYANDVFLTQLVKEQMRKGLSMDDAIIHAEKYFPNYRVASRLMGSRLFSKIMQSPALMAFGRYHVGVYNAYANIVKDLLGPNATGKQRVEAVGHLMMMGTLMFGVYPVLDKAAKWLTDNPDASAYRRGPAAIPNVLLRAAQGHGDISQGLRDTFTVPPLLSTLDEIRQNRDFANKPIMEPGDVTQALRGSGKAAVRVAAQQGIHAASGLVSPVGTAINAGKNQGIPAALRDQLLGIKDPSIRARIYDRMEMAKNQKSSLSRFTSPRTNPVEGWLNKIMGYK